MMNDVAVLVSAVPDPLSRFPFCKDMTMPPSHPACRPSPIASRPHSVAFSLIELIVVIAIVSVMIALLLPALQSARDTARMMQCLSNERQIGMAGAMYADENEDAFPTKFNHEATPTGVADFPIVSIAGHITGVRPTYSYNSSTKKYSLSGAKASPVFVCPSHPVPNDQLSLYGGQWRTSYGFNSDHRGGWMRGPVRMSQVNRASSKVYAMDWGIMHLRTDRFNTYNSASFHGAYVPGGGAYGVQGTDALFRSDLNNGRHQLRNNVLFVDGHAATRSAEELTRAWHGAGFPSGQLYKHPRSIFAIGG